jgi:WD40 repeat protein
MKVLSLLSRQALYALYAASAKLPALVVILLVVLLAWYAPAQTQTPSQSTKPELIVQTGHFGFIVDVMYSPNGQFIASGAEDNTVKIWDGATGMVTRTFVGHKGYITSLDINAAGDMLVSASKDNTIRLWDLKNGKELRQLPAHSFYASAVAFSPTNNIIASVSIDNTVKLWDIRIAKEIPIPVKHDKSVNTLAFSPDGLTLVTGSDDKTVKVLNIPTNTVKNLPDVPAEVTCVAFSADGTLLVVQCDDKKVRIYDAAKQTLMRTVDGFARNIAVSPNGRFVASVADDESSIILWNALNGKRIRMITGNPPRTTTLAFSPDGNRLLSGGEDRLVKIWDVATGREASTLAGYTKVIKGVAFNKQGTGLASAHSDKEGNNIRTWDLQNGRDPGTLLAPLVQVEAITYTQDGTMIAAGGTALDNKSIALWDANTGKRLKMLQCDEYAVRSLSFSPDGKMLAAGTTDSVIALWDVAQEKVVKQLRGHKKLVNAVKFSPDGKFLVSGSSDKTVRVWDVAAGKEVRTLGGHTEWVNAVTFSPDGKTILSASADRTAKLWNAADGKEIRTLEGHKGEVLCAAFSPDGKMIATGATDDVVKLWNTADGKESRTLRGHANWLLALGFHPDGKILASASADAKVILWDLGKGEQLATLIGVGEDDWAVITPDGQFDGSDDGQKLLHWVIDGQPVRLDAFFERYYAPKLLTRIFPNSAAALALKAKADAEEKARKAREEQAKKAAEEKARKDAEMLALAEKKAADEKVKRDAEEKARRDAEEKAKKDLEAKLKAEQDAKAKKDLEEKIKKAEAEAQARRAAEEKARKEAEEKARLAAEEKARKEAAEKALAEEKAKAEAPVVAGVPFFKAPDISNNAKLPPIVDILAPRNGDTLTAGRINLTFGIKDRGGAINEIRIFQNGKLLFPEEFKTIPSAPGYTILRDYSMQLVPGLNTFKVIAFNNDRTESNPVETTIFYNAAPAPTTLYIVSVGISNYLNKAYNLPTAQKDAQALVGKLEEGGKLSYDKVVKYELYNEKATKEQVDKMFKEIISKAQKQDVMAFFYAGHGKATTEGDAAGFYLVLQDVKSEADLPSRGLSAKQLSTYLQQAPAGKQIVMLDACQSAAAVDEFVQAKSMKSMARKTGNSVIAAAGSEEAALEIPDPAIGHGLFTYALLKALGGEAKNSKGKVTADALKRYVEEQVPDLARLYLKGREQTPYGQMSGKDFDVVVVKK